MLVKGFSSVNMSQRTRGIGKRLNRLLYEPLIAIPVNNTVRVNLLTRPTRQAVNPRIGGSGGQADHYFNNSKTGIEYQVTLEEEEGQGDDPAELIL